MSDNVSSFRSQLDAFRQGQAARRGREDGGDASPLLGRMSQGAKSLFQTTTSGAASLLPMSVQDTDAAGMGGDGGGAGSTWSTYIRLPGSAAAEPTSWWETCGLSRTQRYIAFILCALGGAVCFMMALIHLPLAILSPQKFAVPYCMGSLLLLFSFTLIRGFITHMKHLFSRERLPFSLAYLGSTLAVVYSALVNWFLIIIFTIVQIISLVWYFGSYLPGGTSGLGWMTRAMTSRFGF